MSKIEKIKCRVENDVIEVGEDEDAQIWMHPRKKKLATIKCIFKTLSNPKVAIPKKTTTSREFATMTTKRVGKF